MGMGIFGALHVAKEGLYTQQASVSITSHNLANVNTEGYSRQSPVINPITPQEIGGIYFGRGAEVEKITKSYDEFLNKSIRHESSVLGQLEVKENLLGQAEMVFNEASEIGLNNALNEFWSAWEDVANHPEGIPERTELVTQGENLSRAFKRIYTRLEGLRSDANTRVQNYISRINELSEEIATLNSQILGTETSSVGNPNDLTDQRALKIEQLSKIIDTTVIAHPDGQLTVLTTGGKALVSENLYWDMSVKADSDLDNYYAVYYGTGDDAVEITDSISSGSLKGLLEVRDEIVPAFQEKTNQLAASIVTEVNKINYQGFGLDGTTGNYFFAPNTISLEKGSDNDGGGKIYGAEVVDPARTLASDFDIQFTSSSPVAVQYEMYDARNEQYLFHVDAGNRTIVFNDSAGGGGDDSFAALNEGTYTGEQLAAEIEARLEAKSSTGQDYTVTYDTGDREFAITNNGDEALTLKWDDANTTASAFLGFDDSASDTVATHGSTSGSIRPGAYTYADNLFVIQTGMNDTIRFDDGDGNADAVLSQGVYSGAELAAEIEAQLEAAGGDSEYTVTYEPTDKKFTITYDTSGGANLQLLWSDAATTAAATLGFDAVDSTVPVGGIDESDSAGDYEYNYFERLFTVTDSSNEIVFDDGGIGGSVTAEIAQGTYTGEELAAEIEKKLESVQGASGQDYIVSFDTKQGQFSIISDPDNQHDIDINWAGSSAASMMGFSGTSSIGAGSSATGTFNRGRFAEYKKIDVYGLAAKMADDDGAPEKRDVFSINTVQSAVVNMSMDSTTLTDPEKVAAALGIGGRTVFEIDGSNNTIIFDDDGSPGDGNDYSIEIPNGRYTGEALAAKIEQLMEENGSGQSYRVWYDSDTNAFTFASNPSNANELVIMWDDPQTTAEFICGYNERRYSIREGFNDEIEFNEGGANVTATLTQGAYTGAELAAELEQQLEAAGTGEYSVAYDTDQRRFTVTNDSAATVNFHWFSDSDSQPLATAMGFSSDDLIGPDSSGTSDYVPDRILPGGSTESEFATGTVNVGDNRNALDMAELRYESLIDDETQSFDSYYSTIIGDVGAEVSAAKGGLTNQEFLIEQYEERRQSISGVSIDEEMVNLIKYQQAYTACAKMVTTLDRMLDDLLSIR